MPEYIKDHDILPPGWTAALLAVIALLVGADLVADAVEGTTPVHVALELAAVLAAGGGAIVLWRTAVRARREARVLAGDLITAQAEAERWRAEAKEVLRGLGEAIDRQCDRWGLTPAEKEVTLLLLKGLSLKEIAGARETSERTARQQALAVYRKAGLSGRAELAAFFLEDLFLPAA
jgi:DNA-binding CsgD family transcriptional regulator